MRKLIALLFLISMSAFAEEMPAYMKDGMITVTLKDGKQYSFSLNEYKVVRRDSESKKEAPEASKESKPSPVEVVEVPVQRRNRARFLGGVGPTDFSVTNNGSSITMKPKNGAVGGAGYDRMIDDRFSVGGQVLTNGTYLMNFGVDF